jgi:HAD superfamily hydrolase (TIGR01509 family)
MSRDGRKKYYSITSLGKKELEIQRTQIKLYFKDALRSKVKAVLFDMDGTLIDSMKYHIKSWIQAFKNAGIKVTKQEIALFEGADFQKTVRHFAKKNNKKLTKDEKIKIFKQKYDFFNKIYEHKYLVSANKLIALKSLGVKIAITTGNDLDGIKNCLDKYYYDLFDVVITAEDVKQGKPKPDTYKIALKKLNIKPDEAIVVENAPLGIESAKSAKIKTFAITSTLSKKYLKKADTAFDDYDDLFEELKKEIER